MMLWIVNSKRLAPAGAGAVAAGTAAVEAFAVGAGCAPAAVDASEATPARRPRRGKRVMVRDARRTRSRGARRGSGGTEARWGAARGGGRRAPRAPTCGPERGAGSR